MEEELKKGFGNYHYDIVTPNKVVKKLYENKTIIFFNKEDNNLQNFILANSEQLKDYSSRSGWNFLNINEVIFSKKEDSLIQYLYPNFKSLETNYPTDLFLNLIDYKGNINQGFIIFTSSKIYVVDLLGKEYQNILDNFKNLTAEDTNISSSPRQIPRQETIIIEDDIDEEIKEQLKTIEENLYALKSSGKLLLALPYIHKILENQYDNVELSEIIIDENHNIILEKYPNVKLKMSHLTKVVYILFTRNASIYIDRLPDYQEEIIKLYKEISNQDDYDKMMQSVEDLVYPYGNAIYTHISRIKSAFHKVMDSKLAKDYIVTSDSFGSKQKFIPVIYYNSEEYKLDVEALNSLNGS